LRSSSTEKTLTILDLFREAHSELTTEEISTALGIPTSTCYRYLKVMSDQGYLVSTSGQGYSLGPKIILLGYHLRENDPVITACREHADRIVRKFPGTATINRAFRQSFICIYAAHSKSEKRTGFGAGDAMSVLSGANAMVVQAFMTRHLQQKFYDEHRVELARSGRGETFQEFKTKMQAIRQARVCKVEGVVRPDSTGIAAPILGARNQILGTFSFSIPTRLLTPEMEEALKLRVHEIGIRASETLRQDGKSENLAELGAEE
jgi:DNA-binding IclR family transcriptional regulator